MTKFNKLIFSFVFFFIVLMPQATAQQTVEPFTLSGVLIDTKHILLQNLMNSGVKWKGTFDPVGRGVITIRIYHNLEKLGQSHPSENGRFLFKATKPVTHLTVEVDGGGFYLKKDGPWQTNTEVKLNLVDEHLFKISGTLKAKRNNYQMVSAYDQASTKITYVYTKPTGSYYLYSNVPVVAIESRINGRRKKITGFWDADAEVNITLNKAQMITLSGHVMDTNNIPLSRVRIMAQDATGKVFKTVMSNDEGLFELKADKMVHSLYLYNDKTAQQLSKKGPWDKDSQLTILFPESK